MIVFDTDTAQIVPDPADTLHRFVARARRDEASMMDFYAFMEALFGDWSDDNGR